MISIGINLGLAVLSFFVAVWSGIALVGGNGLAVVPLVIGCIGVGVNLSFAQVTARRRGWSS